MACNYKLCSRSALVGISAGVPQRSNGGEKTEGSSLKTEGQESRVSVFGQRPGTEAESGHSQPYPSLCFCLAASAGTKRALFWTVRRDQQIQSGENERGQWARAKQRQSCSMRLVGGLKEIRSPTLSDVWPNLCLHCCEGPFHWLQVHGVNDTH